jgi:UDP-arabinose 4-epimerase
MVDALIRNERRGRVVIVTGGAGYIGSHVCKMLAQSGFYPVTFDNLQHGHPWAVNWGPLEKGDITDRPRLDSVFATYKPEAVLHFAAFAYVGESVDNPGKYYRNNVYGSLNLLEAMRDHNVQNLVFSSSCATYGHPRHDRIEESHPQAPINPYGMSKLMVERVLADFDKAHQIRSVSLRYFNAAGADPDGELGEVHDPETHLIPLVLDAAAGSRDAITVFGNDYETPDGTCIRDYIHVTDLATAHVLALQSLLGGGPSRTYNLGNGDGFSVLQVIAQVERTTASRVPVIMGNRRLGDPARLVGDASLARSELGWIPQYTNLKQIIATAWEWHRKLSAKV